MPDPDAYHAQIRAARDVGLRMSAVQAEAFRRLLEEYAEELSARVVTGLATGGEVRAFRIVREILDQLARDMALATRRTVELTAHRVASMHAQALAELATGTGVTLELGGLGVTAAQAVLARPELAASFRTIRRTSVRAVDDILRRALLRGASADALAMELRLHVVGADAVPPRLLLDRRRIGYDAIESMGYQRTRRNLLLVRRQAGRVANRARLIARTESMGAEWEANIRSAEASPVVAAIHWRLSRRHAETCQCDALARADIYGLGPGHYDPRRVPPRPHPRCICLMLHVLRPVEEWTTPRGPVPDRRLDADELADAFELYPSQRDSLAAVLETAERTRRREAA